MSIQDWDDQQTLGRARSITSQDWGFALLVSVEPSDRALRGWGFGIPGPAYLTGLARVCEEAEQIRQRKGLAR